MEAMQLWGGAECTVNRRGDDYYDQSRLSGHDHRLSDIDLFADLGLVAIRYPILWERTAPDPAVAPDWRWCDARLHRLQERKVGVIAGLVHHGGGPRHTHLLDDGFASGLGCYAGIVAERYPWISDWTPVNEPLTTARFSALYGHWHPHLKDEGAFWRALVNQVDGTREAMRAVRRFNPAARLIQTDDLGLTYATAPLADQASFDNVRRWAGWDLLFGRLTRLHPLWERLSGFGLADRLRRIADDPCPPSVVGVNHYLTSDRFLDHRLERYPCSAHGGNDRNRYADVEAVRAVEGPISGLAGAINAAWERYATPIAITEVHNGCTREEQLRWAAEAWDTSLALREDGVDIRAVTAWSLLGSYGWNTLLTAPGTYESGVFKMTGGAPRHTALAALWQGLPRNAPRHPVAAEPGWWRRAQRLIYAPPPTAGAGIFDNPKESPGLLVYGVTGPLSRAIADACKARGICCQHQEPLLPKSACREAFGEMLDEILPWGVIDADPLSTATLLANACASRALSYATFSALRLPEGVSIQAPGLFHEKVALRDEASSPADLSALIDELLDLLIDGEAGVWRWRGDTLVKSEHDIERAGMRCVSAAADVAEVLAL